MKSPDPRCSLISDHALLRYMERVCHVNIAAFEMLALGALRSGLNVGEGFIIGPDGEHYVVDEVRGTVVTVLSPEAGRRARGAKMRQSGRRIAA